MTCFDKNMSDFGSKVYIQNDPSKILPSRTVIVFGEIRQSTGLLKSQDKPLIIPKYGIMISIQYIIQSVYVKFILSMTEMGVSSNCAFSCAEKVRDNVMEWLLP